MQATTVGAFATGLGASASRWSREAGLGTPAPSLAPGLARGLAEAVAQVPVARDWPLILDYLPPWQGARRADAIILAGSYLLVLSLEDAERPRQAHLDQAMAQARDFRRRHAASRGLTAIPVVVLLQAAIRPVLYDGVCVVSPAKLFGLFKMFGLDAVRSAVNADTWLAAPAIAAPEAPLQAELAEWADLLTAARWAEARALANHMRDEGFDLYLTASAATAADYLAERFAGPLPEPDRFPVIPWDQADLGAIGARDGLILLVADENAGSTAKHLESAGVVPLIAGPLVLP